MPRAINCDVHKGRRQKMSTSFRLATYVGLAISLFAIAGSAISVAAGVVAAHLPWIVAAATAEPGARSERADRFAAVLVMFSVTAASLLIPEDTETRKRVQVASSLLVCNTMLASESWLAGRERRFDEA